MATGTLPDVPSSATPITQEINTGLAQVNRFFLYCDANDSVVVVVQYNRDYMENRYAGFYEYKGSNVGYIGVNNIGTNAYQNAPTLVSINGGVVTVTFGVAQARTNITWYAE